MLIFFVCSSVCLIMGADASVGLNVISLGFALLYLLADFVTALS